MSPQKSTTQPAPIKNELAKATLANRSLVSTGTRNAKLRSSGSTNVSKQARAISLLGRNNGATVPMLMKLTGWQAHSVRGFLSAVVRKKLRLKLSSVIENDRRVYRISSSRKSATPKRKRS